MLRISVMGLLTAVLVGGCRESPDFAKYAFDAKEAVKRQEEAAESLGVGKELEIRISDTVILRAVLIPSGTFVMGSPETEMQREAEEFPHVVTISKSFYVGVTEITQLQWESMMATRPWERMKYAGNGPEYAATYVSWEDAVEFCSKLSAKSGWKVRLPTEAEWEYACRAGTITEFYFGDDREKLDDYAWSSTNVTWRGERFAREVGLKKPNAWGLYDMHGNVFEWCSDWYDFEEPDYYRVSPRTDPPGPGPPPPSDRSQIHVHRGGKWNSAAFYCRSAARSGRGRRHNGIGFRIVAEVGKKDAKK